MRAINLNQSDATRLNGIMMQYVTGQISNPVVTFDAAKTTQYLDINDGWFLWDGLMDYAVNDDNLSFNDQAFMKIIVVSVTEVDMFPPVTP